MVIIYMVDKGDPFPSVSRKVPLDVSILSETKPSNFTKTSKSTIKTQPKPLFFYNPLQPTLIFFQLPVKNSPQNPLQSLLRGRSGLTAGQPHHAVT